MASALSALARVSCNLMRFWRVYLIVPGWERVCVPDMISTRPAMQLFVVFLFEQFFCYERRVPPLFLGRDSGGIRPMVDLVSVLEGYMPPM